MERTGTDDGGSSNASGHVAVVFRGRHVADFGDLTAEELTHYSRDVQEVGRAVSKTFAPCHVNYLLLGNWVPHLRFAGFIPPCWWPGPLWVSSLAACGTTSSS